MINLLTLVIGDTLYYVISGLLTLTVMFGIFLMSKVEKAKVGNIISGIAILLAVILSLLKYDIVSSWIIYIGLAIGSIIGIILAYKIKMIEMPELIALLNGLGGLASLIVGSYALVGIGSDGSIFSSVSAIIAIIIGGITLMGSLIAGGKLHKILNQKPVFLKNHKLFTLLVIIGIVLVIVFEFVFSYHSVVTLILLIILSNLFGYLFTLRIGGADMPIAISLLNSLSGVAGALSGLAINDILLVSVGGIVGASGLLLTQIMCKAMNRKLLDILLGKTTMSSSQKVAEIKEEKGNLDSVELSEEASENIDYKEIFNLAKKVIIVPGYGMAVAQAQYVLKDVAELLKNNGASVAYAIHPVAGRMPGHMNVLLAEADVDYDELYEMDDLNDDFKDSDLVIVVGANDVLNPAARNATDTPIYGMPILNVDEAKNVFIFNYDLNPGYSGVDNPLYSRKKGVYLFLGNALDTLKEFLKNV